MAYEQFDVYLLVATIRRNALASPLRDAQVPAVRLYLVVMGPLVNALRKPWPGREWRTRSSPAAAFCQTSYYRQRQRRFAQSCNGHAMSSTPRSCCENHGQDSKQDRCSGMALCVSLLGHRWHMIVEARVEQGACQMSKPPSRSVLRSGSEVDSKGALRRAVTTSRGTTTHLIISDPL